MNSLTLTRKFVLFLKSSTDCAQSVTRDRTLANQKRKLELLVPNIPSGDSPVGPDTNSNVVIKTVGKPPKFSFKAKSHIELGADLELLDLEAGAFVSGFRGYYLKNESSCFKIQKLE